MEHGRREQRSHRRSPAAGHAGRSSGRALVGQRKTGPASRRAQSPHNADAGGAWRISAGPYVLDACEGTDEWLWAVTRGPVKRSVAVMADHAAIHAPRAGTGSCSVRQAVAARGFTLVFDAIRYGGEPSARIAIGHAYPRVGHATA